MNDWRNGTVELSIDNVSVVIRITLPSHYEAIEFHDEMLARAKREGSFSLNMEVRNHRTVSDS